MAKQEKVANKEVNPALHRKRQLLIERLLKKDFPINWPKEIKTLKQLEKDYGQDFVLNLSLDFPLNSLSFFYTPIGKEKISEKKREHDFILTKKERVVLGEKILGENLKIKNKPKSLKDYMELYNKEKEYGAN